MATMFKLVPADPVSGLDRHIEDFRQYFESHGVSFGSPGDLPPFVTRLGTDARFRDEMASLVRTAIYRERDGFSRLELVDLVAAAVGGAEVEQAEQPEIRDAVRQVMAFVESVFRTRWNPGAAAERPAGGQGETAVGGELSAPEPAGVEERKSEVLGVDPATVEVVPPAQPHASTDLFYRAQMVAGVEPAEAIAEERKTENGMAEPGAHLDPERADESFRRVDAGRDSLPAAEYEAVPLRLQETNGSEPPKKTSRFWMWTAAVCALVLAFCAGLFVHQRLMVPLRDPNQPYEKPPANTAPEVTPEQAVTAAPAVTRPAVREGRAREVAPRRTVRHGGEQSVAVSRRGADAPVAGTGVAAAKGAVEPTGRASESAAARVPEREGGSSAGTAELQPRYMAPAMIGASPALMASHLVYAPPPDYPMLAQISHIRGRVLVEAVVGKSGRVIRAQAISGHRLLRGAAVREVYERRYRPYLLNDRPTNVATIVTVDFQSKK